jgi:hypothetical protein
MHLEQRSYASATKVLMQAISTSISVKTFMMYLAEHTFLTLSAFTATTEWKEATIDMTTPFAMQVSALWLDHGIA